MKKILIYAKYISIHLKLNFSYLFIWEFTWYPHISILVSYRIFSLCRWGLMKHFLEGIALLRLWQINSNDRINKWEQTNKKKQNQEWTELLLVWQWHNIREYLKFPKLDKTENWKWAKAGMKRNPSVGTAALAQYPRIAGWFKPRFGKAWILQNFATRSTFCQWRRLSTCELISLHHNLFKSESDWKQTN